MKPTIIALVPMRHHSQRVPRKNYRLFNGKPLFYWILTTLLRCPSLDAIYIDTDSPVIKKKAKELSDRIFIIDRPARLRGDKVAMNDILLYDVSQVKADYYLQTHSTNPLLKKEAVERAIREFLRSRACDSLFSVTRFQKRLWTKNGRALNHNPGRLEQTQDLPPLFEENSCLYIFSKENIRKRKNRIGQRPLMFEISKDEAFDIDEEIDFTIAETLSKWERRKKI